MKELVETIMMEGQSSPEVAILSHTDDDCSDKRGRTSDDVVLRLHTSPSDPTILIHTNDLELHQDRSKSWSTSHLGSILNDQLKMEAYKNLLRRSVEPEVFIFPSRPYVPLSSNHKKQNSHVNTGYTKSNSSIVKTKSEASKPLRLSRVSSADEEREKSPVAKGGHLIYTADGDKSTVKIDYDKIFASPDNKPKNCRRGRSLSIGEKAFRKVVRQVSRNKLDYQPKTSDRTDGVIPPRNYFDLALFTCCCCISPLGLVALFFAVRTDSAFARGATSKARTYSHVTLVTSLVGIGLTLCVTLIVLFTKFYYYDDDDANAEGMRLEGGM